MIFNWYDEFSQRLSLSVFIGFFVVYLISSLLIFSAILLVIAGYVAIIIPWVLISNSSPPFILKIIFPFHFLFAPYTVTTSYIFYLIKHRFYQFLSLFMALLSSGYFYRRNLITKIISVELYEKVQKEKLEKDSIEYRLHIPEPVPSPRWLWPLSIMSFATNILYLITH